MLRRATDWLIHRNLPILLAITALLLTLPALATGWQFDDYGQRDLLRARPGVAGLLPATTSLFTFLNGDPVATQAQIDHGLLAWWTLPSARTSFWRPISGLMHWLDYQLWPQQPALMHLHSLIWFAALIVAVTLFYRRVMGPTATAGLAALLYACDEAHGFGVAWIANRNAVCATLFGVLALLAHQRWRTAGRRSSLCWSLVWLGCGLLAAEAAIATLAYLLAYALWLDAGSWRQRLLSLLPALLIVTLWRAIYRTLGYGAWGTSYLDPLAEPLQYLRVIMGRGPLLLLGQWSPIPAEIAPFLPAYAAGLLWGAAVVLIIALVWILAPLLRSDPLARFWSTGMLLALLPPCAALPANRLLFFVGIGAMGLLARYVYAVETQTKGESSQCRPPSFVFRLSSFISIRRILLVIHLLLAPLLLPFFAISPMLLGGADAAISTLPQDAGMTRRDLVIVTAPSIFSINVINFIRSETHGPAPTRTLLLASGLRGAQVERPDQLTLIVRPVGGYLIGFDTVFRATWHPLALGEQIWLTNETITVVELTADGRPGAAAFRFNTPLEDATRQWFVWRRGVYVPFPLPPIGNRLWVEPSQ